MKKNAVLIAGIMFVGGVASSQAQGAGLDSSYDSPSGYDASGVSVNSTEQVQRNSHQALVPPVDTTTSTAVQSEPVSQEKSDIRADSSIRGGSLEARGYLQEANNDEVEPAPQPINPGKQADSSIRGGSIMAREREWNHDAEPSSGEHRLNRHMKADSSIRGGSMEARGGREARRDFHRSSEAGVHSSANIRSDFDSESRGDFGQGSSATWRSDKANGSIVGSANWNASDDLLRDGQSSPGESTSAYEINSDASVGGAARSESGTDSSTLDDRELNYRDSDDPGALNASEQLEKNISGEFDLEEQRPDSASHKNSSDFQSSVEVSGDSNNKDTYDSSNTSIRSTDIYHDESDLTAVVDDSKSDSEAVGTAASSETGSSNSSVQTNGSDHSFQSNDPALKSPGSPLGRAGNEPNFLYQDNRAHGVGSLATGEFRSAGVNQSGSSMSNDQLTQKVKSALTSDSSENFGLPMSQTARNIQVSARNGEVTLTGSVPSQQDKDIVEIRAREIAGVQRVHNELTVNPDANSDRRDLTRGSDLEEVTDDLQD